MVETTGTLESEPLVDQLLVKFMASDSRVAHCRVRLHGDRLACGTLLVVEGPEVLVPVHVLSWDLKFRSDQWATTFNGVVPEDVGVRILAAGQAAHARRATQDECNRVRFEQHPSGAVFAKFIEPRQDDLPGGEGRG